MRRLLLVLGVLCLALAALWPWITRLPLGRLPGDLVLERPGLRVYVPWVTMLLVSVVLSVLLRWFRR